MSDDRRRVLDRYTGRPKPETESPAKADEQEDSYQPTAPISANRPPEPMVEFRFKSRNAVALSYALLISATYNPSQGIELEFTTHRVTISGRNLQEAQRALREHRLAWIQEFYGTLDDQPSVATVVTSIKIVPQQH